MGLKHNHSTNCLEPFKKYRVLDKNRDKIRRLRHKLRQNQTKLCEIVRNEMENV